MNAELKAYIDAITDGCCEETQHASITDQVREVFAAIGDAIDDVLTHTSPYHCDVHPWTSVQQTIRECCRHEVIGYHGLA